jgi:hypothetical protein
MLYNCQLSCKVCSPPPAAPPAGTYMPIALVSLPPGTVGALAAADVVRGAAEAAAAAAAAAEAGASGSGNNLRSTPRDTAAVVEQVIDSLAPEASESSAPGEGVHPERRLRKQQAEASKAAEEQRREAAALERARSAEAAAAAAARRRGWLWRLTHPRQSLRLAADVLDDVATGRRAAGGGAAAAEPERGVGDAPGLIAPRRAKRLRSLYAPAPLTMSREDLMRHCRGQLGSSSMAEMADCTDSARLGLAYLTAEEREEVEAKEAEAAEEEEEQEEEEEDGEEGEEGEGGGAAKRGGGGLFGWARRRAGARRPQLEGGRRTVASDVELAQREHHEQAQAGRRPLPKPRQPAGRAPGADEKEAEDEAGENKGRQQPPSSFPVLALMGWLAGLALLVQLVPCLWRRASPRLRARIIRHVKSKGDA